MKRSRRVWVVDSGEPKEQCIRYMYTPWKGAILVEEAHCKVSKECVAHCKVYGLSVVSCA